MPYGYHGRILKVDLSTGDISVDEHDEVWYRRHFGGSMMPAYYLLKETKPDVDPLGPDNRLVIAPGVITGLPVSGTGRNSVGAKSPLGGAIAKGEVGGFFGAELKHAGYDGIVFQGEAEKPVYLWIKDGVAELRDASHLWGKSPIETEDALRAELGEKLARIACIGVAGEKLVRYAAIVQDLADVAGRCGAGAVMGSKKLKAIAVRGTTPPEYADPARVKELGRVMAQAAPVRARRLHEYGTGAMMEAYNLSGNLPVRNFRVGYYENVERFTAERIKETIRIGSHACYACAIRCKKVVKVDEPWVADPRYGGPEYETMAALGCDLDINDLKAIARAHHLCNHYGIDSISAGSTIAFATECFEKGLLTRADTEGLELTWGNAELMLKLLELIGERRGIGDLLAEGSMRAAQKIGRGALEFAMQVKGVELAMHEPRSKTGLAVGFAVANQGGDHTTGLQDNWIEKAGPLLTNDAMPLGILDPIPAYELSTRKVQAFAQYHRWRTAIDTLTYCYFVPWSYQEVVELVNAATGWNTTLEELMMLGERSVTLNRAYNVREGFTPADDGLPKRFFSPTEKGILAEQQQALDPAQLAEAIRTFYYLMGWDVETGAPTRATLERLDIGWVAEELASHGKLP